MERVINLPSFTGCYESIWSSYDEDYFYQMQNEEGFKHTDEWDCKTEQYMKDLGSEYTDAVEGLYQQYIFPDLSLVFKRTWSPQYYDFATDKIDATLIVKDEEAFVGKVRELMYENKEKLSKLIKDNHTSCSGFISFMDNEFDYWVEHLMDEDESYLDYTLYYLTLIAAQPKCNELDFAIYYVVNLCKSEYWYPATEAAKEEFERIRGYKF